MLRAFYEVVAETNRVKRGSIPSDARLIARVDNLTTSPRAFKLQILSVHWNV